MERVAIYLRKSREDEKLERELGKGETLSLHRNDLLKYAKIKELNIVKIYEELVSGESLLYRPAMLDLLKEVESGMYDGVLCMDLQRLGRGDMEEQGIILKAFKKSGTKIFTPDKTYDLDNEFDEEYSEFEAFMSRKEYKMINKRLRRGVMRSVESGNYNSPWRPFGYEIKELKDGRTLDINEAEANIVRLMFNWYIHEQTGSQIISDRLNSMGIKTVHGNNWSAYSVGELLKNPVYTGKIAYNRRYGYRNINKKKATKNRPREEWLIYDGKHEAIVSEEIYNRASSIMSARSKSAASSGAQLSNPLAGLIICGTCGSKMIQRTYKTPGVLPYIMCRNKCGNKSSKLIFIEKAVLDLADDLLKDKKIIEGIYDNRKNSSDDLYEISIKSLQRQLDDIDKQITNAYDLLEKDIYTVEVFKNRLSLLSERRKNTEAELKVVNDEIRKSPNSCSDSSVSTFPENILEAYNSANINEKNMLLKSIFEKVVYYKDKDAKEGNFSLKIIPKI